MPFGLPSHERLTIHYLSDSAGPSYHNMDREGADQLLSDLPKTIRSGGGVLTLDNGNTFVPTTAIARIERATIFGASTSAIVELWQDPDGKPYLRDPDTDDAWPMDYIDPEARAASGDNYTGSQFMRDAASWISGDFDPADGSAGSGSKPPLIMGHYWSSVATFRQGKVEVELRQYGGELDAVAKGEARKYIGEEVIAARIAAAGPPA